MMTMMMTTTARRTRGGARFFSTQNLSSAFLSSSSSSHRRGLDLDINSEGKHKMSSLEFYKVPLRKVPSSSNQRTIFSAAKDALFGGDKKNNGKSSSSSLSSDEKKDKKDDEDSSSLLKRKFSSRKIVRDVAPAELFAIVADVNKYHEFLPFCRRSKVTHEIDKDRFEAELEIGFKVFNERYTSRVTLDRPRKVTAEDKSNEEDGGGALFEKMKTVWRFRELEEEEEEDVNDVENRKKKNVSTVVDFEIAFKVKSSAHAAALSVFFEDVANTQIQAFEKRCRSLMSLPSAE
jgi:coenzyme Q-binding protein COQ10